MKTCARTTAALVLIVTLEGCASRPPCLAYEIRQVQSFQSVRGFGGVMTTRDVAVCTRRKAPDG